MVDAKITLVTAEVAGGVRVVRIIRVLHLDIAGGHSDGSRL